MFLIAKVKDYSQNQEEVDYRQYVHIICSLSELSKILYFEDSVKSAKISQETAAICQISMPKGVNSKNKLSEKQLEHLKKMAILNIGRPKTKKWLEAMKKSKGWKHTKEAKERMSLQRKGRKLSLEHRRKIGLANKGKKKSEDYRNKMSLIKTGHTVSDEARKKFSEYAKTRTREKNPNWRGGLSFQPYSVDWTSTLRRAIRERDGYRCCLCGMFQSDGEVFDVHHINYDKTNCNSDNLVTLCKRCHSKTNGNRQHWIKYFRKLIWSQPKSS